MSKDKDSVQNGKMNVTKFRKFFVKKDGKAKAYFEILREKKWECRRCGNAKIKSDQPGGSGGPRGLRDGTKLRPGLEIERKPKKEYCKKCRIKTVWDRWNGKYKSPKAESFISDKLAKRIFTYYKNKDPISGRELKNKHCVPDHRFPRLRWGESELTHEDDISEKDLREKFQLLKFVKDDSNDNLLKSRACEKCKKTGKRGKIMDIDFYYDGTDENWPKGVPEEGKEAEEGCKGCGWYDVEKWKKELNKELRKLQTKSKK
jgi:hypothetical protein